MLSGHTVSSLLEGSGFGAGDNSADHGLGGSVLLGCLKFCTGYFGPNRGSGQKVFKYHVLGRVVPPPDPTREIYCLFREQACFYFHRVHAKTNVDSVALGIPQPRPDQLLVDSFRNQTCFSMLTRWAELEREAKERERVLLVELEKGSSSLLGAGKGRGGGAGNGLAGVEAGGVRGDERGGKTLEGMTSSKCLSGPCHM